MVKYRPEAKGEPALWHVKYEDGDEEDLTEAEVSIRLSVVSPLGGSYLEISALLSCSIFVGRFHLFY